MLLTLDRLSQMWGRLESLPHKTLKSTVLGAGGRGEGGFLDKGDHVVNIGPVLP